LEPQSVRNVGGRWVSLNEGVVVAGDAFLRNPDAPSATTTVL
jgi:hypothetical protein